MLRFQGFNIQQACFDITFFVCEQGFLASPGILEQQGSCDVQISTSSIQGADGNLSRHTKTHNRGDVLLRVPRLGSLGTCRGDPTSPAWLRRRAKRVARPREGLLCRGACPAAGEESMRARSADDLLGLGSLELARLVRELVLREELDFAALYPEDVLFEVDAGLVGFQHVQAEEEIDVAALGGMLFQQVHRLQPFRHTSITVNEHGRKRLSSLS